MKIFYVFLFIFLNTDYEEDEEEDEDVGYLTYDEWFFLTFWHFFLAVKKNQKKIPISEKFFAKVSKPSQNVQFSCSWSSNNLCLVFLHFIVIIFLIFRFSLNCFIYFEALLKINSVEMKYCWEKIDIINISIEIFFQTKLRFRFFVEKLFLNSVYFQQ